MTLNTAIAAAQGQESNLFKRTATKRASMLDLGAFYCLLPCLFVWAQCPSLPEPLKTLHTR